MNRDLREKMPGERRARAKANMDEVQKVVIEVQTSRFEWDKEHGDELKYASHSGLWKIRIR